MGPISDIGFSVCGWVRFEALGGWAGVAGAATGRGTQGAALGLGCWGWGHAGQQQGKAVTSAGRASQAGSMAGLGDPTYPA